MSKISILLLTTLLIFSNAIFAISVADKAMEIAKDKAADFVKIVELNENEASKIYKILLAKEQSNMLARQDYKGDKEGFKAATKPLNKKYNRQIKDVIGKNKMKKMNQFYKAQRAANK